MIFQFTGLSGAGKTTLANEVAHQLKQIGVSVKVLDGDLIRTSVSKGLGFSKADRIENVKRMAALAINCVEDVVLISAINPYQESRTFLKANYQAKLIWIDCTIDELLKRDTKGLYRRALLPGEHPDKIFNLTGVNDPFDIPEDVDLKINTQTESVFESVKKIISYIQTDS